MTKKPEHQARLEPATFRLVGGPFTSWADADACFPILERTLLQVQFQVLYEAGVRAATSPSVA